MTTLTSLKNPKIKQIRELLTQRKQRDSQGLFVAEGIRPVGEACAAHAGVEYICFAPGLLTSEFARRLIQEQSSLGIPCFEVETQTFETLASKENPQGILAVIRQSRINLESLRAETFPRVVALVAPQDPGNIGSILRTIDAAGASGLILMDDPDNNQYCADPYHPSSVRASMGAIFWYPPASASFVGFVNWARGYDYHIYGTSAHANLDYRQVEQYLQPMILLMGSEREGLTESQSKVCEVMVRIPMHGHVTSLNLAVAAGVLLYSIANKP
jgi:RNA methyltransferase, TrmH family